MDPQIDQPRRRIAGLLLLCGVHLLFAAAPAKSAERALAETRVLFGVRTAFMEPVDGVYLLTARLHIPVDDRLRSLLKDGLALDLELEFSVIRQRGYWFDEDVAALLQRYQLSYHAVSDRYIVRNLNVGEQTTFPTLDAALEDLMRVERLPVLDQSLIDKNRNYEARVRLTMDIGGVSKALRWLMFWADSGRRVSEWYSWRVIH